MGKKVQIILIQEHPKLGPKGKVVTVSLGYARNFLIPQGIAVLATKENLEKLETQKEQAEKEKEAFLEKQKPLAEQLKNKTFTIQTKANKNGKLFGSIGPAEIVKLINQEMETKIKKTVVLLDKPLKEVGDYQIKLQLAPEIASEINLKIQPKE